MPTILIECACLGFHIRQRKMINFRQYCRSSYLKSLIMSSTNQNIASVSSSMSQSKLASKTSESSKYIGTHDGTFHCDDVTACFMLKQLPRFKDHAVVRTRDPEKLAKADIVVDVGGELDIQKLRLDHHQRTFNKTIKDFHPNIRTTNPNQAVKLSSAGLVYAVFGKELITHFVRPGKTFEDLSENEKKMVNAIFEKVYIELIEEIDGIDNGHEVAAGDNVIYNYHVSTGISSRIGRLNPIDQDASADLRLQLFYTAMRMVEEEVLEGIEFLRTVWWPVREQFRKYVVERLETDSSGSIVHLKGELTSWKSNLIEIEQELGIEGQIKYVIYQDTGRWRVTTLPVALRSFKSRVALKEEWRGLRDDELVAASGIEGATFVHASGFTGGANSKEGVLQMCRKSLNKG